MSSEPDDVLIIGGEDVAPGCEGGLCTLSVPVEQDSPTGSWHTV